MNIFYDITLEYGMRNELEMPFNRVLCLYEFISIRLIHLNKSKKIRCTYMINSSCNQIISSIKNVTPIIIIIKDRLNIQYQRIDKANDGKK